MFTELHVKKEVLNYDCLNVLGCTATTKAPFNTPSPLFSTHLPNFISFPTPATKSSDFSDFLLGPDPSSFVVSASSDEVTQENFSTSPLGTLMNCKVFTTPRAGIDPTSEKDLSFGSSFQILIFPSQEPDAKRSEYRSEARAVMYRGFRTIGISGSSVFVWASSRPCARG